MYCVFFFQAEDGIRDLVRSRGLGDVYKRQRRLSVETNSLIVNNKRANRKVGWLVLRCPGGLTGCLLYTSDAADERSSVDLGGRRIIKKKNQMMSRRCPSS